jgi:uncharacterized protein YjiK
MVTPLNSPAIRAANLASAPSSRAITTLRVFPLLTAALMAVLIVGCATRGPNHVYATAAGSTALHDVTAGKVVAHRIDATEHIAGLAYDFNTDHLFLRVTPAQLIRVIERPSGKILREMPLPADLHTTLATPSADLAIRSSDRHLFAVHSDQRSVVELSLYGVPLRRIEFPDNPEPIDGLAFDQRSGHLLSLVQGVVRISDVNGVEISRVILDQPINPISLGYDSDAQHFFVPMPTKNTLGQFDARGRLIQTIAVDDPGAITAIDAGARSFVRVF